MEVNDSNSVPVLLLSPGILSGVGTKKSCLHIHNNVRAGEE